MDSFDEVLVVLQHCRLIRLCEINWELSIRRVD